MFTGIIEEVGTVRSRVGGELVIECSEINEDTQLGDSIAINGVDLTVRTMADDSMTFDVMPETFRRSNLGDCEAGDRCQPRTLRTADGSPLRPHRPGCRGDEVRTRQPDSRGGTR